MENNLDNQVAEVFSKLGVRTQIATHDSVNELGRVIHDIAAPVTSLKFGASLIRSALLNCTGESRGDIEKALKIIESSNQVISGLLKASKSKALRSSEMDESLESSIEHAVIIANAIEHGKKVDLLVRGDLPKKSVNGLTRVLVNLLKNAIEASDENSVVELRVEVAHGVVKIKVIDRGVGISAVVMNCIMSGTATTTKLNGSGIGLKSAVQWAKTAAYGINIKTSTHKERRGTEVEIILR